MQSYIWIFRSGINPIIFAGRLLAFIGFYIVVSDLAWSVSKSFLIDEEDDLD